MTIEHVMLVDDEPDIRAIAEIALTSVGGWRVTLAASGDEALSRLTEQQPDVLLLDVMMPEMDGPTVLARLREQESRAGRRPLPVIFMTARAQRREIEQYLALGACGVITKPFDPMQLADEVRRIVAG